jgi:hypothetical protein
MFENCCRTTEELVHFAVRKKESVTAVQRAFRIQFNGWMNHVECKELMRNIHAFYARKVKGSIAWEI